jgi:hypothetical protein
VCGFLWFESHFFRQAERSGDEEGIYVIACVSSSLTMPSLGSRPSRVTGRPGRQTLGVNIVSLHAREPRALVAGGAQLTGLEHALPRRVASGRMDPADAVSVRAAGSMVRARSLVGAAAVPRAIASVYCMRGSLAGLTESIESYIHSLILPNGMPTTSTTSGRPSMPNKRRKSARSCTVEVESSEKHLLTACDEGYANW